MQINIKTITKKCRKYFTLLYKYYIIYIEGNKQKNKGETKMTKVTIKAKKILRKRATEDIIEIYEANDKRDNKNWKNKALVREWLFDILEERNEEAFWKWIDESEEGSPRKYFT